MTSPAHPRRTTVLVGLLLALVLAVAYAVVSAVQSPPPAPDPGPEPLPPFPSFPHPTPPPDTPQRGKDYPGRALGSLTGRSVITSGHGNADLRYARMPHNGTRVHFTCRGCDAATWLVELPYGFPVGAYGPLESPEDATAVLDIAEPQETTHLLVKAVPTADWTVTLTPFAELPVHQLSFDALDDDVVAVHATADLQLTCGGRISYRTLAREQGDPEYHNVQLGADDQPGSRSLSPGAGTDLLILDVSCPGRWTVTVP